MPAHLPNWPAGASPCHNPLSHTLPPASTPQPLPSTAGLPPSSRLTFPNSGGEEVLLDVGGQDATEAFEDVGHSDEAREILSGMLVGTLKRGPNDPVPSTGATDKTTAGPGGAEKGSYGPMGGVGLYAILLIGIAIAYGGYMYVQSQEK